VTYRVGALQSVRRLFFGCRTERIADANCERAERLSQVSEIVQISVLHDEKVDEQ
jgi:hypothetical protein